MTKEELLNLLREARESVRDLLAEYEAKTLKAKFIETERDLLARIDVALAEGCPDCGHPYGQQDYCQGDGHVQQEEESPQPEQAMNEEQMLKLMKAHRMGADDLRDGAIMQINLMHGLTEQQKKQIATVLNNLIVLPTRILKEFPNV